ncbi:MAG: peptidylprolyl isomerase [Bacteroidales bacterium]|nr:peptidylprolyl isomerase [Bacteroidales bacterium]
MKISNDKVVTLTYVLKSDDEHGEIIQQVDIDRPFVHLFGNGTLLPAFEKNLSGLQAGDTFAFPLTPAEGYGVESKEAILDLDKSIFMVDGKFDSEMVAVGKALTMQDQDGNPLEGLVIEVSDDKVIMDFNHPLAGKHLHFSGKVLDVRDANAEELNHGHVHGANGHHH